MNHFKPLSHEESNTHRSRKDFPLLHLGDSEMGIAYKAYYP